MEDRGDAAYPGMPRWVKAFGVVAVASVLLVVVVFVAGLGADHGSGGHGPADDGGDGNHTRPDDHHGATGGAKARSWGDAGPGRPASGGLGGPIG